MYNNIGGSREELQVLCHYLLFDGDLLDFRCFKSDEGFIDVIILCLVT